MDTAMLKARGDLVQDSSGSGGMAPSPLSSIYPHSTPLTINHSGVLTRVSAEDRPRKRFQRAKSENQDPQLLTGMALPFGRGKAHPSDPKLSHTRRRSTLRESTKPALLGPRPLDSGKR
jgi:hypothetical protein